MTEDELTDSEIHQANKKNMAERRAYVLEAKKRVMLQKLEEQSMKRGDTTNQLAHSPPKRKTPKRTTKKRGTKKKNTKNTTNKKTTASKKKSKTPKFFQYSDVLPDADEHEHDDSDERHDDQGDEDDEGDDDSSGVEDGQGRVRKILRERVSTDGRTEYLCVWEGTDAEGKKWPNSWGFLVEGKCDDVMDEYNERKNKKAQKENEKMTREAKEQKTRQDREFNFTKVKDGIYAELKLKHPDYGHRKLDKLAEGVTNERLLKETRFHRRSRRS